MAIGLKQNFVLRIDREGKWLYDGKEIIHPHILRIFNDGLFLGEDGRHYLRVEDDLAVVEVEDTPFVVISLRSVQENGALSGFLIHLSDATKEVLDLNTFEINEKNIPYCIVKGGLRARFSTQAYYMLAEYIEYNEKTDDYHVRVDSSVYPVSYRGGRS